MSTITTLNSSDAGSTSRGVINTNFANLNTDKLEKGAGVTGNIPTFGASNVLGDSGKTLPTGAIVGLTDVQVLTNKTLTAPAINGGTLTSVTLVTPTLSAPLSMANGGLGVVTLAAHGVVIGNGGNSPSVTTAGTAGQVLTSNGPSADPTFQTPTYPSPISVASSFTAGEALTAGNAVFVAIGTENKTVVDKGLTNISSQPFGNTFTFQYAVPFTVGGASIINTKIIKVDLGKTGSPVDNVTVALQADSSGSPSGIDLATSTFAGSGLSASAVTQSLTLSALVNLTASTQYWIVIRRSGIQDAANYYIAGVRTQSGASNKTYNGSTWSADSTSSELQVLNILTAGQIYLTNASVTGFYNAFIGFAAQTVAALASCSVNTGGLDSNQSGLAAGSQYYLANTYGGIQNSAGSNTRKVGIATSSSSIVITNVW